jgi:hypothetical protein
MSTIQTLFEFICDCGQFEAVRVFEYGHAIKLSGPIATPWETHECPYLFDPRCVNCAHRKREDLRITSTTPGAPDPPQKALES